jgi:tetratricopeptide (TPR) repeat protein
MVRNLLILTVIAGAAYAAHALGAGRAAVWAAAAGGLVAAAAAIVWLPRAAHRAFVRGQLSRSALLYRLLRMTLVRRADRLAVDVSLSACELARQEFARALEHLARIDDALLDEAARCAWLNNRAYALARAAGDATAALAAADEAIALRPDVPGFRHTRGVALLALGRTDDAIGELNAVWEAAAEPDAGSVLEAERCFDLGMAWQRKGERDYAVDYFERAQRAAPESPWARRAAEALGHRARTDASLAADLA